MMTRNVVALIAIAAALGVPAAQAADVEAGHAKAKQVCAACHGEDGSTTAAPETPKLAGQHRDYLAKALRDYKSGARKNPVMAGMSLPLTKEDIDNVSAWYASQQSNLSSRF